MTPNQLLCFRCMEPLDAPNQVCLHCGHDNRYRDNGPGMLNDVVLAGQYQTGRVLGRGGFGVTYIGYDLNLLIRVAIKEYYPAHLVHRNTNETVLTALTGNEEDYQRGLQRALRESRMAAGLRHIPGVVQVYNVFTENNTVYIIMEYVDGDTLTEYVQNQPRKLSLKEALSLLDPVAGALQALHKRGVIHRDVKPDNIMISKETGQGVLLDFGAARVLDNQTLSNSSAVVSAGYAPPEQYNLSSLDGRIDEYALAATMIFTLTGHRPPDVMERIAQANAMPSIHGVNASVPVAAENALHKAMALKADGRYPTVDELWTALTKATAVKTKRPFSLVKTLALALSVTLAGGALAYFVPRTDLWQSVFSGQPALSGEPAGTPTDAPTEPSAAAPTEAPAPQPIPAEPVPTADPEPTAMPGPTPEPQSAGEPVLHPETGLTYRPLSDGTVAIAGYDNRQAALTIPAQLDGKPVSRIDERAFTGDVLTSVVIPEGVTFLSLMAFDGCGSLTEATLPDSLTHMNGNPFRNCLSLRTLHVSENNGAVKLVDGVLYSADGQRLLYYPAGLEKESYQVADGVTVIEPFSFECCRLTSVSLPDSVTTIRHFAFGDCENLTSINLSQGLTLLEDGAFVNCRRIRSLSLPDSLTTIYGNPFYGCSGLQELQVSDSHPVFAMVDGALLEKDSRTLIHYLSTHAEGTCRIPDGVEVIGPCALLNLHAMTAAILPEGVTFIGDYAFGHCSQLTSVTLPASLTTIDSSAFADCTSLTGLAIPEGVTSIHASAFTDCHRLTLIVAPGSYAEQYAIDNGIPYEYPKAASVTAQEFTSQPLEDGTLVITGYNGADTRVTVPAQIDGVQVTAIGESAFRFSGQLTEIVLPQGVTAIGNHALRNCDNLLKVTLPEGLVSIGSSAFAFAPRLTSLTLPASVSSIGNGAFSGCDNLTLIVPSGSYAEQYAIDNGLAYTRQQVGMTTQAGFIYSVSEENTVTITGYSGAHGKVVIPSEINGQTVVAIGDSAFAGKPVSNVILPGNLVSIGSAAFSGCSRLTGVQIPASVTAIGEDAFADCPALTLNVAQGSYAEEWAREQQVKWTVYQQQ